MLDISYMWTVSILCGYRRSHYCFSLLNCRQGNNLVILNYQKEHDFNVFISIDKNTKSFDKTAWTKHNLGMTDKFMEITKHQNNMPHTNR